MIGNDIVDLNLAKTQSNWQRPGFLEKQFTDSEINEIKSSENPFLNVWLFWSIKEAAYKCYVQEFQKRIFAPKKFECEITSDTTAKVTIGGNFYFINYEFSDHYIYSEAIKKVKPRKISNVFLIAKNKCQSKTTNHHLLSHFSSEIQLQKNEFGIPYLRHQGKILPISITTTHHGNYGAYAISYL